MSAHSLSNRVVLVTGGSKGIGLAIAAALADQGARVVITGRDASALDAAGRQLAGKPGAVEAVQADVRELPDVRAAVQGAVTRFGGLDILINNAAVAHFVPVADMTDEQWHAQITTNVTGVFYCCRESLPHLRARGGGWIINISSLAGRNWFPRGAAYCATKAALNAFSEALMQEVRYDNIRVSCIMPGSVNTGFAGTPTDDGGWRLESEDIARVVVDLVAHESRSLPSAVEIRPSKPPRKG